MIFSCKLFTICFYYCPYAKLGAWIRYGKYQKGYSLKSSPLSFSERNGYKKYTPLGFGFRLIKLDPDIKLDRIK